MKHLPTSERTEPAEFEGLEPRLLLAATPFIQPDGPMPQAAGPGCGPPVEQADDAADADADGDGKLGLNDVKTSAAPEPTSLTFNGRGIDLNEKEKLDALNAASAQDGKITPGQQRQLASAGKVPVTIAYEPVWAVGTGKEVAPDETALRGPHVVDLLSAAGDAGYKDGKLKLALPNESDDFVFLRPEFNPYEQMDGDASGLSDPEWIPLYDGPDLPLPGELPIIMDVLGSTKDFRSGAPSDLFVVPSERPILEIVLGSTGDYQYSAVSTEGSISYTIGVHNSTTNGAAGHCKIMALRVANPEGASPQGGPLGAIMGGIGSVLS